MLCQASQGSSIEHAQVRNIGSDKRIQKAFPTHMLTTKFPKNFCLRFIANGHTIMAKSGHFL